MFISRNIFIINTKVTKEERMKIVNTNKKFINWKLIIKKIKINNINSNTIKIIIRSKIFKIKKIIKIKKNSIKKEEILIKLEV